MNRRTLLKQSGGATLALGGAALWRSGVRAQATPTAGVDLSAYPELTITATDAAVQLSTDTVPAGLVLVTVVGQQSAAFGSIGGGIVGPPPGMSFADFLTQVQPPAASPAAGATPDQSGSGGFPAIAYQAVIPGGPGNIDPGQRGQALVNLPAGQWLAVTQANGKPVPFTATTGTPGATPEPTAAVTITEIDFSFAGFDHVPAGPQLWKVRHKGTQPHMLVLLGVPAGTTLAQIMALVNGPQTATPMPGGLNPSTITDAGGVFLQSAGTTVYPVLNLPAGRYAALCFVPDPNKGGEPHAMEGMTSVFDVGM